MSSGASLSRFPGERKLLGTHAGANLTMPLPSSKAFITSFSLSIADTPNKIKASMKKDFPYKPDYEAA
jgi:hypothetical protein